MKTLASLFALGATVLSWSAPASAATDLELWRLDCGDVTIKDMSTFSDTFAFAGRTGQLTDSCYVIRHGSDYLLWDTGLPAALVGKPVDPDAAIGVTLKTDIPTQLKQIGIKPEQIGIVGVSHNHFDHLGQATTFSAATLMIGAADWQTFHDKPLPFAVVPDLVKPWLDGRGKLDLVTGDRDVFGDGSVMMLAMPGHTKGETALLVKLAKAGPVLLSGDVVHFEDNLATHGMPGFNDNRADTLASMERLEKIASTLNATLVIQHDPTHVSRLPVFPASAK
jgi:glyoxylase-like metal-dependent hydrolase (beta-lactamase superfamily II)